MLRVAVLDMQPIDPPVGGGRLRLLGLYHDLGPQIETSYVGTFDWPGEAPRDQFLSPTLRETLMPLSAAHFRAAADLGQAAGGKTVIDSAFHRQVHLSPEYLATAQAAIEAADVVVYSHPWLHPPTAPFLDRSRQLVVYDSQNVEGILRMKLLDDGAAGTDVVREVVRIERNLCLAADLVLACSPDDARGFERLYGLSPAKIRIVPNGAFTERRPPATAAGKAAAKRKLGLKATPLAIFLGSAYDPNVEAARYIIDDLAPKVPQVKFAIVGGVGQALKGKVPGNVVVTGSVSEADKAAWLDAADIAVNPMFSGSGTNIKMLDFMAAGLPVIATPTGARGIETSAEAFRVAKPQDIAAAVTSLSENQTMRDQIGATAIAQVRRFYSWERISANLGQILTRHHARLHQRPQISVIIPTYERPAALGDVIRHLGAQRFRDFEVIVIDQSAEPWAAAGQDHGFDLVYVHTDIRGAVTARNTGAALACGAVLAFTDDDCQPPPGWLEAAAARFDTEDIAGLEGLVRSDKADDPAYRTVTNEGFEGIGFMTANLFARIEVFNATGGFDIGFENPHFREDTDFGWRAQAFGPIPFSREAWLFHPPHLRSIARESLPERSRFFVKDARLLARHPERYTELFLREAQWKSNPHFLRFFAEGLALEKTDLPPDLQNSIRKLGLKLPGKVS